MSYQFTACDHSASSQFSAEWCHVALSPAILRWTFWVVDFKTASWPSLLTLIPPRLRFTLLFRYASMCRYRYWGQYNEFNYQKRANGASKIAQVGRESSLFGCQIGATTPTDETSLRATHGREKKTFAFLFIKSFFLYFSTRSPRFFPPLLSFIIRTSNFYAKRFNGNRSASWCSWHSFLIIILLFY